MGVPGWFLLAVASAGGRGSDAAEVVIGGLATVLVVPSAAGPLRSAPVGFAAPDGGVISGTAVDGLELLEEPLDEPVLLGDPAPAVVPPGGRAPSRVPWLVGADDEVGPLSLGAGALELVVDSNGGSVVIGRLDASILRSVAGSGSVNSTTGDSAVAADMNRCQISDGHDPPVT